MQCPRCGILASVKAERCPSCGLRFHVHAPSPVVEGQRVAPAAVQYAGFWRRFAAFSIDSIILGALGGAVFEILRIIYRVNYGSPRVPNSWTDWLSVSASLALLVFPAIMEGSGYRATPGKMLSGIIVTNTQGKRTGFGRAFARNFLKILSLAFFFVFIVIAFPGKKRGLHDMMTGCLVVVKEPKQVIPVASQPVQAMQMSQAMPEVTALSVQPESKTSETDRTDENWLYL